MRELIIYYLQFVTLCGIAIHIFFGFKEFMAFLNGFIYPIIVTSPITLTLAIFCLIKDIFVPNKNKNLKINCNREEQGK